MYTLKKSLGQHFLRDENICRKIVEAVKEVAPAGTTGEAGGENGTVREKGGEAGRWQLLEVGPGAGAITKYLAELEGVEFLAVELDDEKADYLQQTYPGLAGKIIRGSILDIGKPFEGVFTVVGNFPYNISSQILFRVLEWKGSIGSVTGMFQKEVAQRVAAKEGSKIYGVLSVLIQAYFTVETLFEVSEQCFTPPPKVKSAVIRLLPRQAPPPIRKDPDLLRLVKAAFNQRRKTLRNAVRGLFEPQVLEEEIFSRRAEQLSVEEFAALTWKMR